MCIPEHPRHHAKLEPSIVINPELPMNFYITNVAKLILKSTRYAVMAGLSAILVVNVQATGADLQSLPGWQEDNLVQAWGGWQQSCTALKKKNNKSWTALCEKSSRIDASNPGAIRQFLEQNFTALAINNPDGSSEGVITGYYEPLLRGSSHADDVYRYPVYGKPGDVSLAGLTRAQIEARPGGLEQDIILWTDNPYDLFFLHVQGSGRVKMTTGEQKSLVYAGNNGHEYTSIGKVLIERGEMEKENMSMQTLKQWLIGHPQKAIDVMQQNNRFIFFALTNTPENEAGPRGSLNVPLTPGRSIAIDPAQITPGSPMWLDTTLPENSGHPSLFQRLVFAQDTGAAIKGRVRADVFFGQGDQAEYLAGHMNQPGRLYLLVPK